MLIVDNSYILNKNRYFLNWFHEQTLSGYDLYLDISDLQKFIDYTTFWYESKYPEFNEEVNYSYNLFSSEDISDKFTFLQLMYRLDKDMFEFLKGNYRSDVKRYIPFYDELGNEICYFEEIDINIYSKNPDKYPDVVLKCDSSSGVVKNAEQLGIDTPNITVGNLLYILDTKYQNEYNYLELVKVVKNHKIDLKLRKLLVALIAKKILSNDDCSEEVRANRYNSFIDDFNTNLFDLRLKEEEISGDIKKLFMSL